jgi:hypothetical protein
MVVSFRSLAIEVTLSLLILCWGCAARQAQSASILPGTHLVTLIPPAPNAVPSRTKPSARVP